MSNSPGPLSSFRGNVHSQFGEDGILAELLRRLPRRDRWCVEFGAWDGEYLSNTCRLIDEEDYSAILIEGSPTKFAELVRRFERNARVHPVHAMVGWSERDGLDQLVAETPLPPDFDLLSIDIDGCDYHVWRAVRRLRPKVVCIEFNPSIPPGVEFVQAADGGEQRGCSLDSLVALGREKGYILVATTLNNGIFLDRNLATEIGLPEVEVSGCREDESLVTRVFFGYDGELIILGNQIAPWNGVAVRRMVRQLPKPLRFFPGEAPVWKRKLLGAWKYLARLR